MVDIPKDIQFAKGMYARPKEFQHKGYRPKLKGDLDKIKQAVEMMAQAKRPLFYTGGGVVNSGRVACDLLRELVKLTGFPITSTLMGLGAFPAADPQWLGMLGMHGTWEANWSMHDCDLMICIGARFDDRITGRLDAFSPGSKKIHVDIDPSSINKNVKVDLGIIGDCAHVLEDMVRLWRTGATQADKKALADWWAQIGKWRAKKSLSYRNSDEIIKPQYAIQRLYELTKDRDTYITTEVGQHQMWAAQFYAFPGAEPLDDLGRPRHHGLWPAGLGRRAACASELARHRHRRRSFGADDHAGDIDGGAVRPAGEDLHHQQQVHGHGAAVAGVAARRPLFALLFARRCRISSSSPRPIRRTASAASIRASSTTKSAR